MKLRNTMFAMMALSPVLANAAALDKSEHQVDALFEKGNYAQLYYARVMPKVEGVDLEGTTVKNVGNDYNKLGAAVKFSAGENGNTAFLLKYHQPWGVDTAYSSSLFNGTKANITSDALTALIGYRTASNFWLYGGLDFQQSEGKVQVNTDLSTTTATGAVLQAAGLTVQQYQGLAQLVAAGTATPVQQATLARIQAGITATDAPSNYTLEIDKSNSIAGVAGVAYEYPEIALRADLTYQSAAKYSAETLENNALSSRMDFKFPQSVNFNFQTGIMPKTLLMTKFRWVNWKQFESKPTAFAAANNGAALAKYTKDQYSGSIAIGRNFTDKFAAQIGFEYDSGTGKRASALGPYSDQKGVVVAGQYKINDMIDVAAGVSYSKLGDADVYNGTTKLASFKDSHAIGVGAKLGIHF